jgi:3-isopropylmalate dehydrogenase
MSANSTFHIAVLPGDGIGHEVTPVALELLRRIEETMPGLSFHFTQAPAGAEHYRETGRSMPESTIKLCEEADAILLGACGLPSVRYPDNTEIMPQVELRFMFDLYAGVRPARLVRGAPSPIVGAAERGIDFVVIRESTEGLFASMGKGVTTHDEARETLVITRKTTQRLFDFSLKLAERRKQRGRPGVCTCVDKANVFKSFAWARDIFAERAKSFPNVKTDYMYVDACAAQMVRRPWDFDVMVMENMFGDILSDLAAGIVGGLGMAPSADVGDTHAVFQPCHGTAPDIMGQGKANPTAMILSAAMMLDWLADKHDLPAAADAAQRIERAVDEAYLGGIKPMEFGGPHGTAAIAKAVMQALG